MTRGHLIYDDDNDGDSDYDTFGEYNPRINNGPYESFLQRHSGKSKNNVIILGLISLGLMLGAIFTFKHEEKTGQPIRDDNGENIHLPIILSIAAAILWAFTFWAYSEYSSTFGSMEYGPEDFDSSQSRTVHWEEVDGLPVTSDYYSNVGELIIMSFVLLAAVVAFIYCIYYVKNHTPLSNPLDDGNGSPYITLVISFGGLLTSLYFFILVFKRYLLYRRYSHAPLYSGVFIQGYLETP